MVRYADDFVILARYQSGRLIAWIEEPLEGRFRLTINREKTRVVKLNQPGQSLTFLGFTLRYDRDRLVATIATSTWFRRPRQPFEGVIMCACDESSILSRWQRA